MESEKAKYLKIKEKKSKDKKVLKKRKRHDADDGGEG